MSWSGRFEAPAIESMTVPELNTMRDELTAELAAVVARLQELEQLGIGFPVKRHSVQRRRINNPDSPVPETTAAEPGPAPGLNAHPEGEDAL